MGAWGTGISSNDTYADIYDQFFDLYNEGQTPAEISQTLIRENQETIDFPEDASNFWFALAKAQWECKALDSKILERVERIISSGEDIAAWKELGATSSDLRSRQKALDKFLDKLRAERARPKRRKKKRYYDSLFQKGDCLVYLMDNGNYGGAFVLTDEECTEAGVNYVAITTIDKSEKPTILDFEEAEVHVRWVNDASIKNGELHFEWCDRPDIGGLSAFSVSQKDFEIEVIGNLAVYREYTIERIVAFGWRSLQIGIPTKAEYERINGKPKSKLMLSRWIKKPWYQLF